MNRIKYKALSQQQDKQIQLLKEHILYVEAKLKRTREELKTFKSAWFEKFNEELDIQLMETGQTQVL